MAEVMDGEKEQETHRNIFQRPVVLASEYKESNEATSLQGEKLKQGEKPMEK